MTERDIVNKIQRYLRSQNIFFIKTNDNFVSGLPDLLVFYKGVIFLEVKTPTGRVQEIQKYVLGRIKAAGNAVHVVRSVDEVKIILDNKNLFDKISNVIDK